MTMFNFTNYNHKICDTTNKNLMYNNNGRYHTNYNYQLQLSTTHQLQL